MFSLQFELLQCSEFDLMLFKEISYLANLQVLLLDNNKLSTIPAGVLEMHQLQELSLNDNLIREVPVAVQRLTSLRILSMARNQIDGVLPMEVAH